MAARLEGKVCVVTGARGGIGAATVQAFRREGATVAFTYHTHAQDASFNRRNASLRRQSRSLNRTFAAAALCAGRACELFLDRLRRDGQDQPVLAAELRFEELHAAAQIARRGPCSVRSDRGRRF